MKTSHFLLGLALLMVALATHSFIFAPMKLTISARIGWAIGGGFSGVLVATLLGALIWGIARLFTGAENAPDIRRYGLGAAIILVPVSMVAQHLDDDDAPLTENQRQNYVEQFSAGCFHAQRDATSRSQISDETLRAYCDCLSSSLIAELTKQDLVAMAESLDTRDMLPEPIQKRAQTYAIECQKEVTQK